MFEKDTLFFDAQKALKTALKFNEVETIPDHPVKALQICYYIGDKLEEKEIPKNCIHIELENLYNYFVTTKNRLPQIIDIASWEMNISEAQILAENINAILTCVIEERNNLVSIYAKKIIEQSANFNDQKLRIFIPTIRESTVIQYVSKNLSEAFGTDCEVLYYIADELGDQYPLAKYYYMYEFNPHIVITIDFIENHVINENTLLFCWMQDPMAILTNDEPIKKRKNDFYFVLLNRFGKSLIKKGIEDKKIYFQPFSTNPNIFYKKSTIKKENKIVFLGSDYSFEKNTNITNRCIYETISYIDTNTLTKDKMVELALKYNFAPDYFDTFVVVSLVRRRVIEWVCSLKNITVEVYGTDEWKQNKIVSPFYKGLLPYGEEMANVYNSSKYAIAVHPFYRYQQRVIEISACGSIPVIYKGHLCNEDEIFTHENNVLSFSTLEELKNCIGEKPINDSKQISQEISYKNLATKIINITKENTKNG